MRPTNTRWAGIGLLMIALALSSFSCQRSPDNVQASREEATPGVTNGGTSQSGITHDVLLSEADRNFMKKAEDSDIKEQNLGRVIIQRAQNPEVRDYAKMLVDDHTKDLHKVVDLMEGKGIHQPKNMPEVKHQALDKLNGLSGAELDRAFVDTMIKDHERDVAEYTREETSGEDPAVRDYAARTLLTLEKHLQKAQELQTKLNEESGK